MRMASITIRRLDESVKARLRIRAARHGRSMEEEARQVLTAAVKQKPKRPLNLAEAIRRRIAPLGGVELEIPPREPMRPPPKFE
jgi:plasmid stability protein